MNQPSTVDIGGLSLPLYQARFWLKLIGVLTIIYGVLVGLSIVGLVIAWLPIWMGIVLFQAASAIERAHGASDEQALLQSMSKLKLYFTISGIVLLVMLVLGILGFLVGGASMLAMMQQMPHG
ncbi:MAG: DUF5362 domain-containing protein [Gammaproteobacteria bacterium]|jgi:hypothetical protein